MKETMCTHLAKRGSTYYYRRKTPLELVHLFGKEVMKSLSTKERKLAEIMVRKLGSDYDMLFAEASANLAQGLNKPSPEPTYQPIRKTTPAFAVGLDIDDAEIYASRYLKHLRAKREHAAANSELSNFNALLDDVLDEARDHLKHGVHFSGDSTRQMWKSEAQIKAIEALRNHASLPYVDMEFRTQGIHSPLPSKAPTNLVNSSATLTSLITKWAAERKPTAKTVDKMRMIIKRFEEVVGVIAIDRITKRDAVTFKDALLAGGSTAVNVNQYLRQLHSLLSFAINQAIMDTNPASGVKVMVKQSAKEMRLPFDLPALTAIFNSPIYAAGVRPVGGKLEAAYWLPLMALYTGARVEELCQLNTSDIYQESYLDAYDKKIDVWVFHLTDEGDEHRLKNTGSKRRVPVHKTLIDLGFIKYLQAIKIGRIFPALTPAAGYGTLSANWSKWFGQYLRKSILIENKKMVFHSFRHNFKDYARTAGIATEVHNALTGHSSGDVADNYGSDMYPLRPLVEAMQLYKVTGLVLPSSSIRSS